MGAAYVAGIQGGRRRNASSTALARVAATCKHFAAFGSPQGGLCVHPFPFCEEVKADGGMEEFGAGVGWGERVADDLPSAVQSRVLEFDVNHDRVLVVRRHPRRREQTSVPLVSFVAFVD